MTKRVRLPLAAAAEFLCLLQPLSAQGQFPSLTSSEKTVDSSAAGLLFTRTQSTFRWNAGFSLHEQLPGFSFVTSQQFQSQLLRGANTIQQDEYGGRTRALVPVDDRWSVAAEMRSQYASPTRGSVVGEVSQHQFAAGVVNRPYAGFDWMALGGWELNRQLQESDNGPMAAGRIAVQTLDDPQTQYALRGEYLQSWLGRREPASGSLRATAAKTIGEVAVDSIDIDYGYLRREFYTPLELSLQQQYGLGNNVFARTEHSVRASNTIVYAATGSLTLRSTLAVANRDISRGLRFKNFSSSTGADESIQELQLGGQIGLMWNVDAQNRISGDFQYASHDERHRVVEDERFAPQLLLQQRSAASRVENISERLTAKGDWRFSHPSWGEIRLAVSSDIFRYDTPDTTNTDDRDELFLSSLLSWRNAVSRYLQMGVDLEFTGNHLVYLHRFQSGNNAWNRILRLAPSMTYRPSALVTTTNKFEVLANYTVYDYEEQVASVRSYVFRQFSWTDSTSVALSRTLQAELAASVRSYERGIVAWKAFKEQPELFVNEVFVFPKIFLKLHRGWRIGCGYRSFAQTFYTFVGKEKIEDREITFRGPAATLDWSWRDGSMMSIEGWSDTAASASSASAGTTYFNMQVRFQL